ncbi:MAG: hypothetical protein K6E91_01285 [Butyrivibrio sp.]|nr:hypothetical protein [Butyrivibrio sp.]
MLESNRTSIESVDIYANQNHDEESILNKNTSILGENVMENNLNISKKKAKAKSSKKAKGKVDSSKKVKGKAEKEENKFDPEISASLRNSAEFLMTKQDMYANDNRALYKSRKFNYDSRLSRLTSWEDRTEVKGKKLKYKERVSLQNDMVNIQLSRVVWDRKRFFFMKFNDDGPMKTLKERASLLENILRANREDMQKLGFIDKDGHFIAEQFTKVLDMAYEETIAACDNYLNNRSSRRSSIWGSRRKKKVQDLKKRLLKDQEKYKTSYFAIKLGAFEQDEEKITSPQNLVESLSVVEIDDAEYQKEGNSTDVYRVMVKENGEEKVTEKKYYMKQNLPMLDKDMDGFLKRRISQLNKSQANKKASAKLDENTKAGMKASQLEEQRMAKVHADDVDYKNGIEFLELMKKNIDGAGVKKANAFRISYSNFFKHNFDRLFKELYQVNQQIRYLNGHLKEKFSDWEKKSAGDTAAAYVKELLRDNGIQNDNTSLKRLKEVSASEWIIDQLNLKDADIISFMKSLDKQKPNENMKIPNSEETTSRLEALLRYTTGKEVELYGQIKENAKGDESDMSQYNTMATGLLADEYGFKDEIVQTYIKTAEFDQWDDQTYSGTVTLQEIAEGEEWIEVCKRARSNKMKIRHTENSIRQLIRLQMFDTLCMQQDRHGRNFKCITEEKDNVIYIKSIRAYDHDQSFTEDNLAESFQEKKGKDGKLIESVKNCFLPSTLKVVKKNSPEYRYVVSKYFGGKVAPPPTWMTGNNELKYKDANGKDIVPDKYLQGFIKAYGFSNDETNSFDHDIDARTEEDYDAKERFVKRNQVGLNWNEQWNYEKNRAGIGTENSDFDVQSESKIIVRSTGKEIKKGKTLGGNYLSVLNDIYDITVKIEEYFTNRKIKPESPSRLRKKLNAGKKVDQHEKIMFDKDMMKEKIRNCNHEEKKTFANNIKKLVNIAETYDFSDVVTRNDIIENACFKHVNDKNNGILPAKVITGKDNKKITERKGLFQAWINEVIHTFVDAFSDDEEMVALIRGDQAEPEALAEFKNENGDLEIPGLLHADREAYESVCRLVRDFDNGTIREKLTAKKLAKGAIDAIQKRAKELKERYEYMQIKAEKLLAIKYPNESEDSPYRKFFLDKEDYSTLGKMSDFAIDPGDSYLVQDNEHYLSCQKSFQELSTVGELKDKLDARQRIIKDPKRWNWIEKECPNDLQTDVEDRIAS